MESLVFFHLCAYPLLFSVAAFLSGRLVAVRLAVVAATVAAPEAGASSALLGGSCRFRGIPPFCSRREYPGRGPGRLYAPGERCGRIRGGPIQHSSLFHSAAG